jgi:DNA-binding transcriptional ArsR family regulator
MTRQEIEPTFTSATFAGIADEIEESIGARDRKQLVELQARLADDFMAALRTAPSSVVAAVRGSLPEEVPEALAFVLGKLSFAQLLTAQAAERRADDCFIDTLHAPKYKPYVIALERADLNGVQLAKITGESEETVSRKLRDLRKLGIVEFRRDGTSAINFLTPVARAAYTPRLDQLGAIPDADIMEAFNRLPPQMRGATNFAQTSSSVPVDV